MWVDPNNGIIPMYYTHWDFGEPSNSDYGEDCLEFLKRNRRWNDCNCNELTYKRPICQKFY